MNKKADNTFDVDILIVDDNKTNLLLLDKLFNNAGYKTQTANSGKLALSYLEQKTPLLIVLDMRMPEMDGLELCRRIKTDERNEGLPVIFISAYGNVTLKLKGLQLGAVDFIDKPFNNEEVLVKVKTQISLRLLQISLIEQNKKLTNENCDRKLAEENLKLSEENARKNNELLKSIFDSPKGVIIFSLDIDYKYTAFTLTHKESMKLLWDVDIEVGMNIFDVIKDAKLKKQIKNNFDQVLLGEKLILTEEFGNNKLIKFNRENRYSPIYNAEKNIVGITVFVTDITERVKAEQKLKESEQNYHVLFDTISEGVALNQVVYDENGEMIDYRIVKVNNAFYSFVNKQEEQVIGKTATELYGITPEIIKSFWKQHLNNKEAVSTEMYMPDENKWYFISTSPFDNDMFVTSFFDITIQKTYIEELLKRDERYSLLINNIDEIIYSTETENDPLMQKVTFVSLRSEQILGYSPDEFLANHSLWFSLIHPDDVNSVVESTNKAFQIKQNLSRIYRVKHKITQEYIYLEDHPQLIFDENGDVKGIFGSARNITESKLIENKLILSEERYRKLTENSLTGVYIIENNVFTYVNPTLLKLYDCSLNEVIGQNPLVFTHPDDRAFVLENMQKRIEGKSSTIEYEFRGLRKDGKVLNLLVLGLTLDVGDRHMLVGNILDITEQKQSKEALIKSEERYRRIFDNVQDVFYEVTLDGAIIEISPSIEIVSKGQYKQEDFVGRVIYDFYVNTNRREEFLINLKTLGAVSDYEIELINKDGTFVPCSVSAKILFDENAKPNRIIGTMRPTIWIACCRKRRRISRG